MNERKLVPTHTLHFTKWNPPSRTTLNRIRDLVQSMEDQGFLEEHPIVMGSDNEIGDGNRRLAAARVVGFNEVWVEYSSRTSHEIYADNETMLHHGGVDRLAAYAKGYEDFSERHMTEIYRIENILGTDGIKRLTELGIGPSYLKRAQGVASYAGDTSPEFVKKTLWWLIDLNMLPEVRLFTRFGGRPDILYNAILEGKRLQRRPVEWAVQETVMEEA